MPEGLRTTVVARRRRLSAAQVREAMLEAGQRSVRNAGLTLDLNDSHFDDLIRNAAVPRSSVFRIWQSKADFLVDLYVNLGATGIGQTTEEYPQTELLGTIKAVLNANEALLATGAGRRTALVEAVRQGVVASLAKMVAFTPWQSYQQMIYSGAILTDFPEGSRIADAILNTERETVIARSSSRYAELFGGRLGLRLKRPEYTYEHFVVAAHSVIEGFAIRGTLAQTATKGEDKSDPSMEALTSGTVPGPGIDGSTKPWSPAALAYLAVVDAFFEPIEG